MMLWHTASDHDGPSTSKSILLQSTGLSVTLIPSTTNANLTITPGETKLVSEEHFFPVLSGPATVGLCPEMSDENLLYNRPTSPQSSLSQAIEDILSTDGGIVRSWCNSGSCCHPVPVPQVLCLDVQVLLHVVCHYEDDRMSVRSRRSTVLGISQYGHCNLLPWPHLQSSCLLAACLRHVHAEGQGLWASFFVFFRVCRKASLVSLVFITDLNCIQSVSCSVLTSYGCRGSIE
jgi:hypothetical protein